MGFFRFRKNDVIDLTEGYKKRKSLNESPSSQPSQQSSGSSDFVPLGFFASQNPVPQKESFSENSFDTGDSQEKRKKLAKRLVDMTDKIEDLSNQIYHLQQRVELLERKVMPDINSQDY